MERRTGLRERLADTRAWFLCIYTTSRPGSLKERLAYLVLFLLGAQWKRWKYKNGNGMTK